ncbi:MAG: PAS domain S-box protein, partial [Anaerolineae bacterium]|nr:PAS domain S-box protein [Anaerolineae bacterium]
MSWTNIITVPLIATIVSLYVGVHVLRCHKAKGAVPLAIMFFAGAQWSLGYAFELICVGLDAKIFWDNVQFLGSTLLFPAIFIFVLQYTDHEGGLRHWGRFLLVMEPAATNVLAWTNPLHGLIRRNAALDAGGPFTLLTYDWGPWLWVSVAYGIFLLALPSMIMLAVRFMRTPPRLRSQIGMILLGVLIPWVGGILTVSGLFPAPVQHLDLTPLTFTMGCLLISWGLFRYRLFQFRPATYETIIAHVMDGVVVLDMQKQVVELNPAAEQLLDLPATRILERPITDLLPGYTVQQHPTECVLGQGEARRYVEVYTSTLGDTSRALNGWLLVLHDITEGKHIEAALRESEAKYRSVAEQANDGIVILQGGLFTYCNAQFAGMLGYAVDDLVGAPFTQVLTLEYRETVARHHGRRIQGAEDVPSHYEVEALHRDGRHIVVEINAGLMVYEGRPASLGIVRDITERKRAEAALRESEEKFRLLVETSTDVIWTLDEAQHFTYVSPAIMELRGLTPEEALQESLADAICPEFLPRITESYAKSAAHHAAGKTGFIDRIEIQQPCKDGGRVWVEVVTRELYDEAGNRTGVLGISRNISARKQMEAELIRAKEAAESANRAKSIFLANMSHELRTPLNIVLGYTGLMSHDPQLTREQRENLEIIVRNGEHLLALINDVLDLSKIEAGKVAVRPEIFDLCELLEGLRELFHVRAQQKGLEVRLR